MLYEELLASCKARFDAFFQHVPIFENQFTWSELSARCYDAMYERNAADCPAPVSALKKAIPELPELCKKCGAFFLPQRNDSIPDYDRVLGQQHEEALMDFLSAKLSANVVRADLKKRGLPDCKLLKPDGSAAAYFEVKFHGAPFVLAAQCIHRPCYEGSATLDYEKIKKQLALIRDELDAPTFYVHWLEYPCLKGIFYETSEQVAAYIASGQAEFSRKLREGDKLKSPQAVYRGKVYSPLLQLGDFAAFVAELDRLLHA